MKKCILSAIAGAVGILILLCCVTMFTTNKEQPQKGEEQIKYEHEDFLSSISQENCFICGEHTDPLAALCWQQDNIAILDLNTFEMLSLEINRYTDDGDLVTSKAGYMQTQSMETGNGWVYSYVQSDRGYADVYISGVEYNINPDSIQNQLCQSCLNTFNSEWYGEDPPAEFAVVHLSEKIIEPLTTNKGGFGMGDYYIDCSFEEDEKIDLLVFYCPNRYA